MIKVNNLGLGMCYVLKESENGYLMYSETNKEHFIVTKEIRNNSFYYNQYFNELEKALEYFNSLEKELSSSDEYRKRIEKYLTLEMDLQDIENYTNGALEYLKSHDREKYDLKEIIMYLSCVPETIEEIVDIITEIIEDKNS